MARKQINKMYGLIPTVNTTTISPRKKKEKGLDIISEKQCLFSLSEKQAMVFIPGKIY